MSKRNCVLVAEDSVWKPSDVRSPYPPIYYITERFIGSDWAGAAGCDRELHAG